VEERERERVVRVGRMVPSIGLAHLKGHLHLKAHGDGGIITIHKQTCMELFGLLDESGVYYIFILFSLSLFLILFMRQENEIDLLV
jgi:hypothetical protein